MRSHQNYEGVLITSVQPLPAVQHDPRTMPNSGDLWLRFTATCSDGTSDTKVFRVRANQGTGPQPDSLAADMLVADQLTNSENLAELSVFPNPATDVFSLSSVIYADGEVSVTLFSTSGALVFERAYGAFGAGDEFYTTLATDLPPGVYYLNLTQGDASINTRKIILR